MKSTKQKTRRLVVSALVAALAATMAIPATASAATEYTGWQSNNGWNRLSGCTTYRYIRADGVAASDGNICSGDVGVKGKFVRGGTTWITPWDWDYRLAVWKDPKLTWLRTVRVAHE